MCYKKPGPRCSAHARAALMRAGLSVKRSSSLENPEKYLALKEKEAQARQDFDATPAGKRYLERRMVQYQGQEDKVMEYQARLELGQARRAEQLALLKAKDEGDVAHDTEDHVLSAEDVGDSSTGGWTQQDFPDDDEERIGWETTGRGGMSAYAPGVDAMVEESEKWFAALSPEEHDAVSWFTSDGSHAVNNYLATGEITFSKKYDEDFIKENAENLRSALDKYEPSQPTTMVWRGLNEDHFKNLDYGGHSRYSDEGKAVIANHVRQTFIPGEEWRPGTPMSTTYDPSSAVSFTPDNIILEVKARKAAPVCIASAWGVGEREAITHPDARYRVVAVKEDVPFSWESRRGDDKHVQKMTVIQLEEL